MTTWASRIKDLRASGLNLAEIGEAVGLAPTSVSDIEQGRSRSPRGEAALRIFHLHEERCSGSKPPLSNLQQRA